MGIKYRGQNISKWLIIQSMCDISTITINSVEI